MTKQESPLGGDYQGIVRQINLADWVVQPGKTYPPAIEKLRHNTQISDYFGVGIAPLDQLSPNQKEITFRVNQKIAEIIASRNLESGYRSLKCPPDLFLSSLIGVYADIQNDVDMGVKSIDDNIFRLNSLGGRSKKLEVQQEITRLGRQKKLIQGELPEKQQSVVEIFVYNFFGVGLYSAADLYKHGAELLGSPGILFETEELMRKKKLPSQVFAYKGRKKYMEGATAEIDYRAARQLREVIECAEYDFDAQTPNHKSINNFSEVWLAPRQSKAKGGKLGEFAQSDIEGAFRRICRHFIFLREENFTANIPPVDAEVPVYSRLQQDIAAIMDCQDPRYRSKVLAGYIKNSRVIGPFHDFRKKIEIIQNEIPVMAREAEKLGQMSARGGYVKEINYWLMLVMTCDAVVSEFVGDENAPNFVGEDYNSDRKDENFVEFSNLLMQSPAGRALLQGHLTTGGYISNMVVKTIDTHTSPLARNILLPYRAGDTSVFLSPEEISLFERSYKELQMNLYETNPVIDISINGDKFGREGHPILDALGIKSLTFTASPGFGENTQPNSHGQILVEVVLRQADTGKEERTALYLDRNSYQLRTAEGFEISWANKLNYVILQYYRYIISGEVLGDESSIFTDDQATITDEEALSGIILAGESIQIGRENASTRGHYRRFFSPAVTLLSPVARAHAQEVKKELGIDLDWYNDMVRHYNNSQEVKDGIKPRRPLVTYVRPSGRPTGKSILHTNGFDPEQQEEMMIVLGLGGNLTEP